jgi:hypothetical protein
MTKIGGGRGISECNHVYSKLLLVRFADLKTAAGKPRCDTRYVTQTKMSDNSLNLEV